MKTILSVACIGIFAACQPAKADIIDVTATGTVASGFDSPLTANGPGILFGTSTNLVDQPFTAHFTFDTSLNVIHQVNDLFGGSVNSNGTVPPTTFVSLTINNQTVSFNNPTYSGQIIEIPNVQDFYDGHADHDDFITSGIFGTSGAIFPGGIANSFSIDLPLANTTGLGEFKFSSATTGGQASGFLNTTHISALLAWLRRKRKA